MEKHGQDLVSLAESRLRFCDSSPLSNTCSCREGRWIKLWDGTDRHFSITFQFSACQPSCRIESLMHPYFCGGGGVVGCH